VRGRCFWDVGIPLTKSSRRGARSSLWRLPKLESWEKEDGVPSWQVRVKSGSLAPDWVGDAKSRGLSWPGFRAGAKQSECERRMRRWDASSPNSASPTIEPQRTSAEEKPPIRPPLDHLNPKQEPRPRIIELSSPRQLSLGGRLRF
jgi:hypothetical protein